MPSSSQFYYSVLRISIIQILRAAGFDRCSNRVVDILTDLYVRHLALLSTDCQRLAANAYRLDIEPQDVSQALVNLRVVRPGRVVDPFDVSGASFVGMRQFVQWVKGEQCAQMRRVAVPTKEMIEATVLADPAKSDNNSGSGSGSGSGSRNSNGGGGYHSGEALDGAIRYRYGDTDVKEEVDWLKYLLKTQSRGDYDDKIKMTVLNADEYYIGGIDGDFEDRGERHCNGGHGAEDNDFVVMGPTPKYLMDYVPCRKKLLQEMH